MTSVTEVKSARFQLQPRRGVYLRAKPGKVADRVFFEDLDLLYRTLCGVLFNFVPTSGHPGGSISSGRIVEGLLYETMDYDFSQPDAPHADRLSYAAGHKAMGLYAMWALRNELVRIARPELLAPENRQLRLEDLLGFRRNPTQSTPLFKKHNAKALDGHPTPAAPFVSVATGASGVGVAASLGLAFAMKDIYGEESPRLHILEGEGGLTPGRVHEAISAAATQGLENVVLHVDWNQASIDSNKVCAENGEPGDYVQWNPIELFRLHDWNVLEVGDGFDFKRIFGAQALAKGLRNGQPTAIVYRTVKGWKYGIEGKKSHGAGHAFCSEGYYKAAQPFEERFGIPLPRFEGEATAERVEAAFFETLMVFRKVLARRSKIVRVAGERIAASKERLGARGRKPREGGPNLEAFYQSGLGPDKVPQELHLEPGKPTTIRGALGQALHHLNRLTSGAVIGSAADLLDSTSVSGLNAGFPEGFYHSRRNPGSRLVAIGGICEDAMGGFMGGLSSFGQHVGVTSSYAAFIAPLEHIAARLHGIGQQARRSVLGDPFRTWVMINAHAGPMTGEDGPTHADPQPLQLLQENFPAGVMITLTPWEPQEVWPLLIAGLRARPAVLAPFVTRPPMPVPDRKALGLPPASAAVKGIYAMRRVPSKTTVVLQGSGVASIFIKEVLPQLEKEGLPLNAFYVSSVELFDRLSRDEQESIFPEELARHAIGITDFTLPTLYRWVHSAEGIRRSLHPFRHGYLGSGVWTGVLREGGLDGPAQLKAIKEWAAAGH